MLAVSALLPVFLLILMGHLIKRWRWVDDAFWAPAERITYYIFFPALLIVAGARADLNGNQVVPMAVSLFGATLLTALLALALKPVLGLKDAAFTSFFQGTIRPNTYVGVAVALLMYADAGVALISIAILAVVPMVNVIVVSVMVKWSAGHEGARSTKKVALEVARNPLVIACLIGFGMNGLGIALPPILGPLLDILGRAALPVALMAVGAGLDLADLRANAVSAARASILKLLVLPALAWLLAFAQGMSGVPLHMTILYASLSGSASSYVLEREMGGDTALMAGIITATTLAAMASMPLWLVLAG